MAIGTGAPALTDASRELW